MLFAIQRCIGQRIVHIKLIQNQLTLQKLLVMITLAVKLETTCKPTKPPTNHSQTSQTTCKPAKYKTNHLLINQKLHRYFPEDIFNEQQHFPCPSCAKREIDAFLDVSTRFRLVHCTVLYHS